MTTCSDMELKDFDVTLPEGVVFEEFRPVAYFDEHMDCIRVLTHERSVTERRVNEHITLFAANHREDSDIPTPEYVGFSIKGVRQLFHDLDLPMEGVYKLAELVDRVVKHKPGSVMATTLDLVYQSYQTQGDLPVEFNNAA